MLLTEFDRSSQKKKPVVEGSLHNPGQDDNAVAQAIIRRILMQRTDLLAKYGPGFVGQAVDDVADSVGDVDEIGSSDVSGWVKQVEWNLQNKLNRYDEPMDIGDTLDEQGVAEGSLEKIDRRGFLKGLAAAGLTAMGGANASLADLDIEFERRLTLAKKQGRTGQPFNVPKFGGVADLKIKHAYDIERARAGFPPESKKESVDQGVAEATESEIDKHLMEMHHAGYDLTEGHGSYYCSTKKRMVQRKGPKQSRSSK